jgi:hypothetical protein
MTIREGGKHKKRRNPLSQSLDKRYAISNKISASRSIADVRDSRVEYWPLRNCSHVDDRVDGVDVAGPSRKREHAEERRADVMLEGTLRKTDETEDKEEVHADRREPSRDRVYGNRPVLDRQKRGHAPVGDGVLGGHECGRAGDCARLTRYTIVHALMHAAMSMKTMNTSSSLMMMGSL